jgi:hypothetical protein
LSNHSLITAILRASRAAERAHRTALRDQERRQKRAETEARHALRQRLLQQASDSKQAKEGFNKACEREVMLLNATLTRRVEVLEHLLTTPLGAPTRLSSDPDQRHKAIFATLRATFKPAPLDVEVLIGPAPPPPKRSDYETLIEKPTGFARILGGQTRYDMGK